MEVALPPFPAEVGHHGAGPGTAAEQEGGRGDTQRGDSAAMKSIGKGGISAAVEDQVATAALSAAVAAAGTGFIQILCAAYTKIPASV